MEIDLAKEHQKKTKATNFWSHTTFSGLMAYSPKEAAKYAISCNIYTEIMGLPAKEYIAKCELEEKRENFKEEQIKKEIKAKEDKLDAELKTDFEGDVELKIEDLKELLKENNIKFHKMTGIKKLIQLAKENNLL